MVNKILKALCLIALVGCTRTICPVQPTEVSYVKITAEGCENSKTSMSGNTLTWTEGDEIGMFIGDLHSNVPLYNSTSSLSVFSGGVPIIGVKRESVGWYAYYPYTEEISGTVVSASLPPSQSAPFDKSANYMVADVVSAKYDESDMPTIPLSFNTQLFSIVKISVSNSEASYQNEKLKSVELVSTEGKRLAGAFSFDITDPLSSLTWQTTTPTISAVSSDFSQDTQLGLSSIHTVYLFVRPDNYKGLQIRVRTDCHVFSVSTIEAVNLERGNVTTLPDIDVASQGQVGTLKKIACWGDSFTHGQYAYPPILQTLLGNNWCVFDGGISGDRTIEIAARQGGIRSYINGNFVFPSSGSATISGIYLEDTELTVEKTAFRNNRWGASTRLLNPCIVSGIECTVTNSSVTRTLSGDSKSVASGAEITTYGARYCRDADVSVIYMGENGGYNSDYDLLIKQHWAMIDFTTTKRYIVLAFHNRRFEDVEGGYLDKFNKAFGSDAATYCPAAYDGKNHVIDLRWAVVNRGAELLVKTGVYSSKDDLTESDKSRLADGLWPYPFWTSTKDCHPNTAGETAISYLIHDKMVKLGYLEDSYILDDVTDL